MGGKLFWAFPCLLAGSLSGMNRTYSTYIRGHQGREVVYLFFYRVSSRPVVVWTGLSDIRTFFLFFSRILKGSLSGMHHPSSLKSEEAIRREVIFFSFEMDFPVAPSLFGQDCRRPAFKHFFRSVLRRVTAPTGSTPFTLPQSLVQSYSTHTASFTLV